MSCTKCKRPINNNVQKPSNHFPKGYDCLLKMQDGRSFTDYRPRCTIQYQMKNEDMPTSYSSRQFLINNANNIMKANMNVAEKMNGCSTCFNYNEVGTMLPEKNMVKCNKNTCDFKNNVMPSGLGTGRVY